MTSDYAIDKPKNYCMTSLKNEQSLTTGTRETKVTKTN